MKPVVSPVQDSLELTDEALALHAWRMPDMVHYQHAYEEWWLAPLEDTVPLVKINRAGLNLLNAMNGKVTDRKSTRLNSSHVRISYAVFCLKKKKKVKRK